jgi:type IV pilus assembly protein PilQ
VSASGEVTVEIHPEFKTPVGIFSSEIPPTINTRVIDSTVRLKDGETIILGGLIEEKESKSHSKVPILGDIPILGNLFRTSHKSIIKTELMIYITPHIFYGDESDTEKWDTLKNNYKLEDK